MGVRKPRQLEYSLSYSKAFMASIVDTVFTLTSTRSVSKLSYSPSQRAGHIVKWWTGGVV